MRTCPTLLLAAVVAACGGPTQAGPPGDEEVAARLARAGGFVRLHFRLGPHPSDTSEFYAAYDTIVERLRRRGLPIVGLFSNESWHGSQADWTANSWEHEGGDGHNGYIEAFG